MAWLACSAHRQDTERATRSYRLVPRSGVQPAAELNSKAGAGRGFVNPPSLGVGDGPEGLRNVAQTTAVPTDAPPSPR